MESKKLKIVFVIDESGSMQGSNSDVIGGFNSFIEKYREQPELNSQVSLYKFNNEINTIISNKPVKEVSNLSSKDYTPSGFTALFDAVGFAISETDKFIADLPPISKPDSVMVVVFTDGQENASKIYTSTALKSTIQTHEKMLNWNFIYLGADIDNFADADLLGFENRISYQKKNMYSKFDRIANSGISYSLGKSFDFNTDGLMDDLKD